MTYEVLIYGNPALRKKAAPIEKVDGAVKRLAKNMLETMHGKSGIGLAAEQIGRTESICVIDISGAREDDGGEELQDPPDVSMPLVLINPEIIEKSGEQTGREGCLSFPEIYVSIKRAAEATVRYMDLENEQASVHARGLLARVIQHEVDHLNGILLADKMSMVQKAAIAGKLKRLKRHQF